MRRSTDCLDSKRWRSLTVHCRLFSHLPVKGLALGTGRIMATTLRVLAPVYGIKAVIHSVDGHRSVYRQIYKEWNEIESGSFKINTYSTNGHAFLVLTS